MAVVFDAVGPSSSGTGNAASTSLSWTHTVVGSLVALFVGVTEGVAGGLDAGHDFTVTCDGISMSLLGGPVHGFNQPYGFIKAYGLTGISSGPHAIVVTATGGTPTALAGGSLSFTGAASFGTAYTAFGNSGASSVSVAASTSGNVIVALVGDGHGGEAATSPATLQYLNDVQTFCIGNCAAETTPSTGGAVTVGFTQTSDYWAIIALEVMAPVAPGTPGAYQRPAPQVKRRAPARSTLGPRSAIAGGVAGLVNPPPPPPPPAPVITTTGATFSPVVALTAGSAATVTWSCTGFTSQTGTSPSFNFGTVAVRTVTMTVTGGGGYGDVTLFNIGYNNTVDPGLNMPPAGFAKAPELVSGVADINSCTGLIYFLADFTPLAGVIDFTGMAVLQFIQCDGANVNWVTRTGCAALIRLQIEACNQTQPLDLNPVAGNLRDLRSAIQQSGQLQFANLISPMSAIYHFCVRDQFLINPPSPAGFPVIQQFWTWNEAGAPAHNPVDAYSYALSFTSNTLFDITSYDNQWSSADLTNMFPAVRDSQTFPPGTGQVKCDLHNNRMTSVNLTGCQGLQYIDFSFNRLPQPVVDGILTAIAGWGTSNNYLDLRSNTAPSAVGTAAVATLTGNGWTVHVDVPSTVTTPARLMDGVTGRPGVGSSGTQPPSSSSGGGPICTSLNFEVTAANAALAGYYIWRADLAQAATADAALWIVTGVGTGTLVPNSHVSFSGMLAGQFNFGQLASPISLTQGTVYAVVGGFPGNFPATSYQFGGFQQPYGAGIANGPLFAFSSFFGVYPDSYNDDQYHFIAGSDPTADLPVNTANQALGWVDVQVGFSAPGAPPLAGMTRGISMWR